jgi:uncharacterized protein (DUF4415 family)
MSAKLAAELRALEKMPEDEIDTSDMPEVLDWNNAAIGKYYRPVKRQVSIRLDLDILAYFMGQDKAGYQVRINDALRQYVAAKMSKSTASSTKGPTKAPSSKSKTTSAKRAAGTSASRRSPSSAKKKASSQARSNVQH